MLLHALAALVGSLAGLFAGSPLVSVLTAAGVRLGVLPSAFDPRSTEWEHEILQMRVYLAGGQFLGVTAAVSLADAFAGGFGALGRIDLLIGFAAGFVVAAAAWTLTRLAAATNNALMALVPAALLGSLTAASASYIVH